jgi:hypothetical protein
LRCLRRLQSHVGHIRDNHQRADKTEHLQQVTPMAGRRVLCVGRRPQLLSTQASPGSRYVFSRDGGETLQSKRFKTEKGRQKPFFL